MKACTSSSPSLDLDRLGRIVLHARCLWRDRKYRWHLAGIWRELTLDRCRPSVR